MIKSIGEKQELLAEFLIRHCNLEYNTKCIPIGMAAGSSSINKYLGKGVFEKTLYLVYLDKNSCYATSEICRFKDDSNDEKQPGLIAVLDYVKDYYATHYRKFKALSWARLKNIVKHEKPTNLKCNR